MRDLYNYIEERINYNNNHSIELSENNIDNEILLEIQSHYYYELSIKNQNEMIIINKFDFEENEEEYEILSINSLLFENEEERLYEIIYNFIFNLINYIK